MIDSFFLKLPHVVCELYCSNSQDKDWASWTLISNYTQQKLKDALSSSKTPWYSHVNLLRPVRNSFKYNMPLFMSVQGEKMGLHMFCQGHKSCLAGSRHQKKAKSSAQQPVSCVLISVEKEEASCLPVWKCWMTTVYAMTDGCTSTLLEWQEQGWSDWWRGAGLERAIC